MLWRSIGNTLQPPIDPAAVRAWAERLPDDPALIDRAVHQRLPYALPWQTHGVPWVFPSPAAALAAGYADCQGRAVVLASVLAAKGIPYRIRASLDHMWVEYAGKREIANEQLTKVLWTRDRSVRPAARAGPARQALAAEPVRPFLGLLQGAFRFRLPQIDWHESYLSEKAYFWDAAPPSRKLALVVGWLLIWWRAPHPALRALLSSRAGEGTGRR
ncbi:MAG: transglutaminase domain-containing protein [Chloroflexota bacterium]